MRHDNAQQSGRLATAAAAAAAGSVAAWGLKAATIAAAGGLDRSPLEGPLFLIGFLLLLVAFAVGGAAALPGRRVGWRIVAGIAALAVGMVLFVLLETGVGALVPESAGWVKEEAGLWVVSVLTAALLGGLLVRRKAAAAPATP